MALPVCSDMATRMTRYSAAGGFAGAGSARLGPGRQLPRRRRVELAEVRRVLPRRAVYDNNTLIFSPGLEVNVVGTLELDSGGLIVVNELDGLVVIVADTVACQAFDRIRGAPLGGGAGLAGRSDRRDGPVASNRGRRRAGVATTAAFRPARSRRAL